MLDFLFDKSCIFCAKKGHYVCNDCLLELQKYKYPNKSQDIKFGYYYKDNIRNAILSYKFGGKKYFKRGFSLMLTDTFNQFDLSKIDIFTYVPISKIRERERGYNQCELILKELCKDNYKNKVKNILKRKNTKAQSSIGGKERTTNVIGKFSLKCDIKNKTILLFDDVYTTGSTIKEVVNTLYNGGAYKVYVLILAKKENMVDKFDKM